MPQTGVLIAVIAAAVGGFAALTLHAQSPSGPPNPFAPPTVQWATLADGRAWGSTAGIELGPRGELWAIDRCGANSCEDSNLPSIHRLDAATGRVTQSIGAGLFVFPHGLHVDSDGNVWVTDARGSADGRKGNQVIKLAPDGTVLLRLGVAGTAGGGPKHLNEPSDVITAPNGDIFVVDGHAGERADIAPGYVTRVVKFAKDGTFLKEWGRIGNAPGEFRNPHGLAIDGSGRLFVADRGNARIQIFNLEGAFITEWRQFGSPSGLYIDAADRLYVADATSSAANAPGFARGVRIGSARTGEVTAFVPGHTTATPGGTAGEGVLADEHGHLYTAENVLRGITKYAKL